MMKNGGIFCFLLYFYFLFRRNPVSKVYGDASALLYGEQTPPEDGEGGYTPWADENPLDCADLHSLDGVEETCSGEETEHPAMKCKKQPVR